VAVVPRKSRYGTRFLALYRDSSGRQKSAGTFSTKKEAQGAYLKAKADVLRGVDPAAKNREPVTAYPKVRNGHMTVSAFAARWIDEHLLQAGSSSYSASRRPRGRPGSWRPCTRTPQVPPAKGTGRLGSWQIKLATLEPLNER
jgi:hypothetical protein